MTEKEWEAMKNIDVTTVDLSSLIDIQDIRININLSKKERIIDYIKQIKNPYCYKCGTITVKTNYPYPGQKFADIFTQIINKS